MGAPGGTAFGGTACEGRRFERINFLAANTPEAQHARARLVGRYGDVHSDEADVVVALGGDGLMLQTLHRFMGRNMPIYGMNRGSVGFLMNDYSRDAACASGSLRREAFDHPSADHARGRRRGRNGQARAINEVSLLRQTSQTAKLRISVDGAVRLDELDRRRRAGRDPRRLDRL